LANNAQTTKFSIIAGILSVEGIYMGDNAAGNYIDLDSGHYAQV